MLLRPRGNFVGLTLVAYQEVGGYRQPARGGADHVAEIAETVVIGVGQDGRIEPDAIRGQHIRNARRMDAQRQDHRRGLRAVVGNFVARTNLHRKLLGLSQHPVGRAAVMTFTATFMVRWSDEVPIHVPCSGIASRGSRTTATRTRFLFPTVPLDGSKSTQPGPGT